jgi:phage-related minor tail protein
MASTIKGITVKIAGETTDLQKALKNIQSSSRSLQSELKTINNQLKFDPDNTVLLAQKQDVLREQIDNSTNALKELVDVEEQVKEQAKNGEISTDQYRAYQREVEKTKSQLENFKKQLADTEAGAKAVNMKQLESEMSDVRTETSKTTDSLKELEDKSNNTNLSKFKKEVDDVKSSASELKDVLADTAAGIGAALGAVGGSAIAAITSANSEKKALNSLQAQTGLTKDELLKYKSVINDIYKNNFGESQEEIADTLAKIKQFTGETDPGKMKELAENLYTLQDTFGYDIPESLRAVNMLMEQFGISSIEAFNLVVQGSQRGLDKNGDFLDTLNEYSVHYQQMGYNANEFINSLVNGTVAGTFSVDKLGDAMKEFGIRVKDTSTSTQEGFNLLGYGVKASAEEIQKAKDEIAKLEQNLSYAKAEQAGFNEKTSELTKQKNADKIAEYSSALETAKTNLQILESAGNGAKGTIEELQAKFAAGGDTAKEATQEVLQELFNMDDKIKQNQVGVDLFGTMWEDLGADGVKALMEINGTADLTKDSMQKIKDIKYDDVESDWEELGRTIQTDIINPIGKSLFPEVKSLCDFTSKHTDKIIPVLKTVGSLTAGIWIGKKTSAVITATSQLVNSYKVLKTATEGAALAQEGLNLAQKANAIGAVVSIATTLIGTIYAWSEASRDNSQELDEWQEKIDVAKEKNKELTDSYQNFIDKRNESVNKATSENQYYDNLWEELKKIVDENGKVNEGYEDRAKFITTKLRDLTGTEITLNDNVIENYKELRDTIQEVIDKKKANNILSAYESNYNEAVTNKSEAQNNVESAQAAYESAQRGTSKVQTEYNKDVIELMTLEQQLKRAKEKGPIMSKIIGLSAKVDQGKKELDSAKNFEQEKKKELETSKKTLQEYLTTIDNYENLQTAILNENEENTSDALRKIQNDFITAKSGTEETLKQQCVNYRMRFTEIQQAIAEGKTDYYTADDLTNMQLLLQAAEDEYNKYCQNSLETGEKATSNVADGIDKNSVTVYESANKVSKKGSSGFASDQHERVKIGSKSVNDYASGIDGNSGVAREAGVRIGKSTRNGVRSISLFSTGNNFVQGFINGISLGDAIKNVWSTATGIGGLALGAVKKILGINSPSREAKKIGSYFTEGLVIGINDNKNKVKLSTENLASSMLGSFDFVKPVSYIDILNDKFNNIRNLDNDVASRTTNKVVTHSPKVELNYYGDVNINTDLDIDNFNERVSNAIIDTLSNEC